MIVHNKLVLLCLLGVLLLSLEVFLLASRLYPIHFKLEPESTEVF
jgi:hypothetical protein